jgi:UvrD-like helicase C-terminal domain
MTQHYTMLQRNLVYTGVTRGKRLVVLVGQKKAVAIAVRSVSGRQRWSKLREWLNSWMKVGYAPESVLAAGERAVRPIYREATACG